MRARGWNNSTPRASGAGYGVRIDAADRDRFFRPNWPSIFVQLPNEGAAVLLSPSFWATCSELRSSAIGRWLLREGLAPWPTGKPPVLELIPLGGIRFRLAKAALV